MEVVFFRTRGPDFSHFKFPWLGPIRLNAIKFAFVDA